jgi:hypothetical protein
MKRLIALTAALLIFPASAFAMPVDLRPRNPLDAPAQDLRSPDQRAPRSGAIKIQARGTDVAAVDQQSPQAPARVHAPVVVSDPGFDWGPAAIGAATSAAVLIALLGAAAVRRRHRLVVS